MAGEANGFDYAVVGEDVVVSHHGRRAITLRGQGAQRFLAQVDENPQEVMARVTGNYKRGNERTAAAHRRNQGR